MSRQKLQKKKGGSKKYLRNKRAIDTPTSLYAKGKISFETYMKMISSQKYH